MVAKIGRSSNLFGTLSYNNKKMEQDKGEIIMTNKMIETFDGKYTVSQLAKSFEPYVLANKNTEKHTLHISLNPHPDDQVSNAKYMQIAQEYMNEMGYGNQPYVVFKHTDIERSHIHIVSVCVDENGKKISDKFEKIRSMKACRAIENQYGLINTEKNTGKQNDKIFKPVKYDEGNIKKQIASVIRHLPHYYQFQTLGEYNALLSLYNITSEKVQGELDGKMQEGLLYVPVNEKGDKAGNPIKASRFGKEVGLKNIQLQFEKNKSLMKNHPSKQKLKTEILNCLKLSKGEKEFKKQLSEKNIDCIVRRNDQEKMYGITFIDHQSKTVWNGSRLGKEFSANTFNDYWNSAQQKPEDKSEQQSEFKKYNNIQDINNHEIHDYFDLFSREEPQLNLIEGLGGLLPYVQIEDVEEINFVNRMKKKTKKKKI